MCGTFIFSLLPLNMPSTHKRDSTGRRLAHFLIQWSFPGGSNKYHGVWPGFKSRCRRHMWVEFVVGSLLFSERFFSGYVGFPLSSKTSISKFQFDQVSGRRRTTMWMCYLPILIYLFIYLFLFLFIYFTLLAFPVEPCGPNKLCPLTVEVVIR